MKKNIRIAIRIDKFMDKFLQEEADILNISVGQYIRQIIKVKQDEKKRTS